MIDLDHLRNKAGQYCICIGNVVTYEGVTDTDKVLFIDLFVCLLTHFLKNVFLSLFI